MRGVLTSARATASRCCCPPERVLMRERRLLLQADQVQQAVDPRRGGVGAIERGEERDDLGAAQVVEQRRRSAIGRR